VSINLIQLHSELEQKQQALDLILKKIDENEKKLSVIDKGLKLVKLAKSYKIESRKKFILDLINTSLHTVFGKEYNIDLIIDESKTSSKYNVVYKIVLYKNGKEVATNQDLFTTTGGGVITIISFIIKIALGYINTKNKFYILDEVFSQVSEKYKPGIARLLRILVDKYGFTFLVVSHDKLEEEDIDLAYYVTNKPDENNIPTSIFTRTKIRNNLLLDDAYKITIKNFQSIKELTIDIKGITVIYGNSDSGKSALQRAISSVILNDFKPKLYPRWKKGRNKLTTTIRIQKNNKFIELEYKDVVKYRLDNGEEFTGKKLASENISKALENLGFIKIDVSNLSGELKTQINRIYVTTQFDKLFLPDDRNGVEKILTILFNSQIYNYMIQEINRDFNEINSEIKRMFNEKQELEYSLKIITIEYLKELHNELNKYISKSNEIAELSNKINSISDNRIKINNILLLLTSKNKINRIRKLQEDLVDIQKQLSRVSDTKSLITELINEFMKIRMISTFSSLNKKVTEDSKELSQTQLLKNIYQSLILLNKGKHLVISLNHNEMNINVINKKLKIISQLKNQYLSVIKLLTLITKVKQHEKISSNIIQIKQDIESKKKSFNICKCPTCNGKGYTICKGEE